MRKLIVFTIMVFECCQCCQLLGHEKPKEFYIGFRVGQSTLDTNYVDNAKHLSEIITYLNSVKNDSTLDLVGVSFYGASSPEGSYGTNRKLAEGRLISLEQFVRNNISIPDSIITRSEDVVAWERLAHLVKQSDMPYKEEAINVLCNVPEFTYDGNGTLVDSRKKQLMELQYGRTWNYMEKHFFAQIRNASVTFVTARPKPVKEIREEVKPEPEPKPEPQPVVPADTVPDNNATNALPAQSGRRNFYMDIKTNMLYDLLAVPNIGIEFYLGKNWSVGGSWMYGWWDNDNKNRYWRIYGGELAVRKWLGKKAAEKPLTGHHLGVYGQAFSYDFEWGGKGYMGGQPGGTLWDKANYAVGIEYGYSLPITRQLNIDFVIGVGYWGGKYYEYTPLDGHDVWQATKQRHWFGPTKAEISLVWLLGRGNTNSEKGGVK